MVSKQTVTKKRDKEASKRALLEAAIAVFSERGYDAATTKEVAKRAGVSEALIARYFEGKVGLLLEIVKSFSEELPEDTPASLPFVKTLREEILQLITFNCKRHKENAAFMKVVLSRAIVDPALGRQMGTLLHSRKIPVLQTRLMHYLQKGGIASQDDLPALAFAISALSFTLGFMGPEVMALDRARLEAIANRLAEILAEGAKK